MVGHLGHGKTGSNFINVFGVYLSSSLNESMQLKRYSALLDLI